MKALSAQEAFWSLKHGNQRFVTGLRTEAFTPHHVRIQELALSGQNPSAILLSCSDSRVPAEIVFDQGLGDLFVIRVAGNITAPSLIGSVEFAAAMFNTELVVVMGHSGCGAIRATLDYLDTGKTLRSENVQDIIQRVRPHVEELTRQKLPVEELMKQAVRANIRASAAQLRHGSRILERLVTQGKLIVVGAECKLETGEVDFFDGVPEEWLATEPTQN